GCPAHFLQLCHQVLLRVQAAGGINDHVIRSASFGSAESVEQYGRRIAARLGLDHLCSGPSTPNFKLLDRSGSECIRRAHQNRLALASEEVGELPDSSRFACSIDSDNQQNLWAVNLLRWNIRGMVENRCNLLFQ